MRKRSLSREFALQVLYQIDITSDPVETALNNFWKLKLEEERGITAEVKDFTDELAKGVIGKLAQIDGHIGQYAANWELTRMAVVDRNILRLGCYELLFREDIPPKVSINEAVELAKKYSGMQAGKFVNGILDKIKSEKTK